MQQVILIPGAKAANADIDLPTMYPKMRALKRVSVVSLVEAAPPTYTEAVKTIIYTGVPGAGDVILVDEDTIHIGDATIASDFIILDYVVKGEYSGA